jgi:hypothetical protein
MPGPYRQMNMRVDPRTERLLQVLQAKLNIDATNVIRLAVARLAELEGVRDAAEEELGGAAA